MGHPSSFLTGTFALLAALAAACTGKVETVGAGGGGTTTSGTAGSSGVHTCAGLMNLPCPAGEFCAYDDGMCGFSDGSGTCKPEPQGCDDVYAPACGCDGQIYPNACTANSSGVDTGRQGPCAAPSGYFRCGGLFCLLGMEYCQEPAGNGPNPTAYSCNQLPSTCGTTPSCACLTSTVCGSACHPDPDGGLHTLCSGQ